MSLVAEEQSIELRSMFHAENSAPWTEAGEAAYRQRTEQLLGDENCYRIQLVSQDLIDNCKIGGCENKLILSKYRRKTWAAFVSSSVTVLLPCVVIYQSVLSCQGILIETANFFLSISQVLSLMNHRYDFHFV